MSFFKSLPASAGPPQVFAAYPELYGLWSEMSQVLMNGPSPLSPAERELILAFAAGTASSKFVYVAHSEVAYAWGVEEGLLDHLLDDLDAAPVDQRLKPILAFVRKLTLSPASMTQADADAVFAAGWDEKALHDAIAVTARMSFMQRLVEGYGFKPWTREVGAREEARKAWLREPVSPIRQTRFRAYDPVVGEILIFLARRHLHRRNFARPAGDFL